MTVVRGISGKKNNDISKMGELKETMIFWKTNIVTDRCMVFKTKNVNKYTRTGSVQK